MEHRFVYRYGSLYGHQIKEAENRSWENYVKWKDYVSTRLLRMHD